MRKHTNKKSLLPYQIKSNNLQHPQLLLNQPEIFQLHLHGLVIHDHMQPTIPDKVFRRGEVINQQTIQNVISHQEIHPARFLLHLGDDLHPVGFVALRLCLQQGVAVGNLVPDVLAQLAGKTHAQNRQDLLTLETGHEDVARSPFAFYQR